MIRFGVSLKWRAGRSKLGKLGLEGEVEGKGRQGKEEEQRQKTAPRRCSYGAFFGVRGLQGAVTQRGRGAGACRAYRSCEFSRIHRSCNLQYSSPFHFIRHSVCLATFKFRDRLDCPAQGLWNMCCPKLMMVIPFCGRNLWLFELCMCMSPFHRLAVEERDVESRSVVLSSIRGWRRNTENWSSDKAVWNILELLNMSLLQTSTGAPSF